MSKVNVANKIPNTVTHEGASAKRINAEQQLRRFVMCCTLWENSFYIDGESTVDLIKEAVKNVSPEVVAEIAYEARTKMKLRHVPLLLARELARGDWQARLSVADLLEKIIQRPDELSEFLAIYWKDGKQPISAQVKKGLARAFGKFDEFQLAKYNRDGAIKLRDVLFLVHAKPKNRTAEKLYKKLVDKELKTPDTWEVNLSAGKDKKDTFTRLLKEENLGALALLRNLRKMKEVGVEDKIVAKAISKMKVERVLPFRFISAAKYAPHLEPELEEAMFKCLDGEARLKGKTILLVDASGSMEDKISGKSELSRFDTAVGLAILLRELCQKVSIYAFSNNAVLVPSRRGFGLRDALLKAAEWSGTQTENAKKVADKEGYDRLIILTDEQSHQALTNPKTDKAYVINVGTNQNGIGYGKWIHIDGWSEAVVDFIVASETQSR